MAYKLIVSPRAQKEIESAIDYYALYSTQAPHDFVFNLKHTYDTLKIFPFFRIRYRNIRALKIKKFPYSLYYIVDESQKTVKILSCFHNRQNPDKRPYSQNED
jgi:plasmid stabilization system protein ParE